MKFDWNIDKAETNIYKHGVSFEEASTVFYDENAIVFDDPDHSDEKEERFNIIGFSDSARLLIVCHCVRGEDEVIRIISARIATKRESKQYEKITGRW